MPYARIANTLTETSPREHISLALDTFRRYQPLGFCGQMARSTYKQGQLFQVMGLSAEAARSFEEAYILRTKIVPNDIRSEQELTERDYDELVMLWSR